MSEDKTMKKVLPKIVEDWIGAEDICFRTGKVIGKEDLARWTSEFDAWISTEGQLQIEEAATGPDSESDPEALIIYREWYAKDEANAANDDFKRWHK